jgi:integrase
MTRLRKMMLEELERRNYSEATTRCYIRTVEDFSRRFKCSPDGLGPEHIREYQAELFKKRKLSPGTVTQRLAALRFFYIKTLKKSIAETPYPERAFHLPSILSREEVARLIDAALTPYHRTLLMTLYATGVRRAELTHLKVSDIDSNRMVIHVQGGKGRKDRDVMLSPKLLTALREQLPAIPNISAQRSASSACCTRGVKNSNFTRMYIAWCRPADSLPIAPAGANHATPSFFLSKFSVASFAASSSRHSSAPFTTAGSTFMETCNSSLNRKPLLPGCDHCSERTGWSTRNHRSEGLSMYSAIWAVHSSRSHLQPPTDLLRQPQGHVSLA